MKWIILFFISLNLYAGTCTTVSRTNAGANTVLTSTKYNNDLNTLYTNHNAFDGGCITDGTLEPGALNSEFDTIFAGIHQGCKVTRSNASTISVDRCILTLSSSNIVKTTAANTESMGCTGCSGEASDTTFYVYAKSDSDGTTLNLLLLTTAPNGDGFDGSGNKVLAKIYNNGSSDIDADSIVNWSGSDFENPQTEWTSYTPTIAGLGTVTGEETWYRRVGDQLKVKSRFVCGTSTGATFTFSLPADVEIDPNKIHSTNNMQIGTYAKNNVSTQNTGGFMLVAPGDTTSIGGGSPQTFSSNSVDAGTKVVGTSFCTSGQTIMARFEVPIAGWD